MMTVTVSETDMQRLQRERFEYPHPRVQRKMEAVYLTGLGQSRHQVAQNLHVTEGTVRSYLRAYQDGGVDALCRFNPHPKSAELDAHTTTLRDEFETRPPHTVQEAIERIEELTGIRRSPTQVRAWLKKQGFARRKTGQIPAKVDPEAQQRFLENELEPVLNEARAGKRHVFSGMRPISS